MKQVVRATIVSMEGLHFIGENDCTTPQATCPRAGMATGVGYHLCKEVCGQESHAEVAAIQAAGGYARGGTLYLSGHYYACEPCQAACRDVGIVEIIIGEPPEENKP